MLKERLAFFYLMIMFEIKKREKSYSQDAKLPAISWIFFFK